MWYIYIFTVKHAISSHLYIYIIIYNILYRLTCAQLYIIHQVMYHTISTSCSKTDLYIDTHTSVTQVSHRRNDWSLIFSGEMLTQSRRQLFRCLLQQLLWHGPCSLATGASTCNRTQETSRNPTSRVSGEFSEKAWSKNMQKPIGDLSKESRYLQNAESWSNLKHKSCIVLQPSSCEALEGNCRCHPTLQVDFPGSLSACQTATTIVTSTEQQKHHQQSRQNSKNLWDVCLTWGLNYLHRWFLCSFIMFPHLQIPILALQSA